MKSKGLEIGKNQRLEKKKHGRIHGSKYVVAGVVLGQLCGWPGQYGVGRGCNVA